jgi:hypothetical protein
VTLSRIQPGTRAVLGLSLMLSGVVCMALFAGLHELRWFGGVMAVMIAEDLIA